jgi:hypothetical protein
MELKLGFKESENIPMDKVTWGMIEKAKEKFGELHILYARPKNESDQPVGFPSMLIEDEETEQPKEALVVERDLKAKVEVEPGNIACVVMVPSRKVLDFCQDYVLNNKIKSPTIFYQVMLKNIWLAGDPKIFDDLPFRAVIPQLDDLTERMVGGLKKL